jgi:hypothetical protein
MHVMLNVKLLTDLTFLFGLSCIFCCFCTYTLSNCEASVNKKLEIISTCVTTGESAVWELRRKFVYNLKDYMHHPYIHPSIS